MSKLSTKVVLDTNILISDLLFGGKPQQVIDLAKAGKIQVIISPYILKELEYKLTKKFKFPSAKVKKTIREVKRFCKIVKVEDKLKGVCSDPTDDAIIETAVNAGAGFLITGDHDLLNLKRYGKVQILTPAQFLKNVI